jgi:sterol desaturase/sphingolipid hydroxylase (fatty acid hydroxylase superfamily)
MLQPTGATSMTHALYIIPAAIVALFLLERSFPLRKAKSPLGVRLFVNAVISALALATALVVVTPVATAVLQLVSEKHWGLTQIISTHVAVQAVVAFLLLDLSFYYWHRANHAWPLLWRFHNAHHIDPDLDVSTAMRFHVVEIGYSAAFRALQVLIIGGAPWLFIAYETAFQLNTLFHHSNVRLPVAMERWLNLVIVTPRMHGIHHSKRFDELNSNWSSVFSWWDRLHGTLRLNVPQADIDIGVAGYSLPQDNGVRSVLAMPFRTQRDYWRDANGRQAPSRQGTTDSAWLAH